MGGLTDAVYELSKSPPTHDFVNWLVRAERMREYQGAASFNVVIVPGNRKYSNRDMYYTYDRRTWRITELLMPLARLVPTVADVSIGKGEQVLSYLNPGIVSKPIFKAPDLAKHIIESVMPSNVVTITLRQSDFELERNSNQDEWKQVAEWLQENGYCPVFIPDAEADMRGRHLFTGFSEYIAASYNFALRLALWEHAKLNLMHNSGPMVMALYSDVPLLCFKMYVPGVPCCAKEHMLASGFSPEHDWSTPTHQKKLFWEEDTAKNIIPVLAEHLNRIGEVGALRSRASGLSQKDSPAPTN